MVQDPPVPMRPYVSLPRSFGDALWRGTRCLCLRCGEAKLFRKWLEPHDNCPACALDISGQRADDFPAYIVILLLGHILVPLMIETNRMLAIPLAWQSLIWPGLAAMLAIALIQPVKGGVIALQWSRHLAGFS